MFEHRFTKYDPVMPHGLSDGQQFPIACPSCKRLAGMPYMAGTTVESGAIRVGMRCKECLHEWRFDMPVTVTWKRERGPDSFGG